MIRMVQNYPRLWTALVIVSLAITTLSIVGLSASASLIIAAILILFVGIPHGAADHRIFQQLYADRHGLKALVLFYVAYLGLMGMVFLLWYYLPVLAFWGFISLSCYHFGQGNFAYLPGNSWRSKGLFVVWGIWIVAMPVLLNYSEAHPVLEILLQKELPILSDVFVERTLLALTLGVIGWLSFIVPSIQGKLLLKEYFSLLVIGLMFWHTSLFLGFAVYFALWHALPSAFDQVTFLWQETTRNTLWKYATAVLPFSLLSLGALALLVWWVQVDKISQYWSWLFVFIAAVTLPHMLLLDKVYKTLVG